MSSVLHAGTNSELYLRAKQQLAPYRWGVVIESNLCWVHLGVGSIEYHHIVPQTYGGRDGPQVAICGNCHTGVHNLSYKSLLFDGSIDDMTAQLELTRKFAEAWISRAVLNGEKQEVVLVRAWALAEVIFRSRRLATAAENSAHKRIKFNTEFSGEESRMLKVLKKHYGVNQDQMIHLALSDLYSRVIGDLGGT